MCGTPNFSPMYSNSQAIIGLIYQPSLICLPFSYYEAYWAANMNVGTNGGVNGV